MTLNIIELVNEEKRVIANQKGRRIGNPLHRAGMTRLELATFGVTGRHSNQTELHPRIS